MTTKEHLEHLYSVAGFEPRDPINAGEICAYSRAVDMLRIDVQSVMDSFKPFLEPNHTTLNQAFDEESYVVGNRGIVFLSYNPITIGKKAFGWIIPFVSVSLGGSGKQWSEIEQQGFSWHQFEDLMYSWSLIESEVTM